MQRVEQSIKNTIISIGIQFGTILLNFISRTVLIKTLGEQYLGINGLFSNILTMLSLVEMGVGSALIYLMYKPMAENDEKRLSLLMAAYAKIYTFIGGVIFILGISLTPFLGFFMKEVPEISHIRLIYIMYIVNMSMTYLFSYRASIINVAQKNYIVNTIKFVFTVIQYIVQIAVLIVLKNYILYYFCAIIFTVLGNWAVYKKAEKMFPYINKRTKGNLSTEEKAEIKKNIFAMFFHRLGTFVVFGTDNIIISKFIGIIEVGIYSNYTLITSAISTALNLVFTSITSSIGNLVSQESKNKTYDVFENIFFANSWISGFCAVCLFVLLNPFIEIWLGERFVFETEVVAIIVINFYLTHVRLPANVFKEVSGLFWNDRYKSFVESLINLVFSLILVNKIGILGVFVGTLISTVTVCFWVEPYVLYKNYFKRSIKEYFFMFLKYTLTTIFSIFVIYLLSDKVTVSLLFDFVYKMLLCILIPNISFVLMFGKSKEFRYFGSICIRLLQKIKK